MNENKQSKNTSIIQKIKKMGTTDPTKILGYSAAQEG
jgi:hypothetical protein